MEQQPNLYLTTAAYYDSDNEALGTADVDFYRDLALKTGGPVLDLCCGTGRIALPLTITGLDVTAVDLSEPMLSVMREKATSAHPNMKKLTIVKGDMRYLQMDRKFKLIIIALRSFQVLQDQTDIDNAFTTLYRQLAPDGLLVIDLFKPLKDMKSIEGISETKEFKDQNGKLFYTRYGINHHIDTENQVLHCDFEYLPSLNARPMQVQKEKLKIRYYYEQEFQEMLHAHRFRVIDCFGDYDRKASDHELATELLFVCRRCYLT